MSSVKVLLAITIWAMLPAIVENTAQSDLLGPLLFWTVFASLIAAAIYLLPVRNRP